jgi:hypothetical protein
VGGGWFEKKEGAHRPSAAAVRFFKNDNFSPKVRFLGQKSRENGRFCGFLA